MRRYTSTPCRRYPWGAAAPTPAHASFGSRVEHATPVGVYPRGRTPEGLCDLGGNVWEWCADWFGDYSTEPRTDPTGPDSGTVRVLRGGAFGYHPDILRAAYRYNRRPAIRNKIVGQHAA